MIGRKGQKAFALLLVVTLLAFLVILLVGLATYTRVETAVAGNTQRQAQARENALLALNVAVAHLQKYIGADKRVTATADAFPNELGTRHYTGVWPTDPVDYPDGDPLKPLTWLVSGNELTDDTGVLAPRAVTPEIAPAAATSVVLVGANTSRTANDVRAPLVPLTVSGVPGVAQASSPTIGRYAWWIGDQGVKAPVAAANSVAAIAYAPYDSAEALARLRQQAALGAGPTDENGVAVFEPRDANNTLLVQGGKVVSPTQIAFLRTAGTAQLALATVQTRFHDWTADNFVVLADVKSGGLRRDLSLRPDLLGQPFQVWANFRDYMEIPSAKAIPGETATSTVPEGTTYPEILPKYSEFPVRRRYRIQGTTAPVRIAPVLSFFGLSFSVRNSPNTSPTFPGLEVSSRCVIGLWNPYSAALVPEDLQIVVKGLPDRLQVYNSATGGHLHVNLADVMQDQVSGTDMKLHMPFKADGVRGDRSSWLPGRVYNWAADSNTIDPPSGLGKPMIFYERAAAQPGSGIVRVVPGPPLPTTSGTPGTSVNRWCEVTTPTQLTIELLRASNGEKIAEFQAPLFSDFTTDPTRLDVNDQLLDFAFIFRLPDATEIPLNQTAPWLQAAGRDPRQYPFPASGYVGPGFGLLANGTISPALLIQTRTTTFDASYPDRLLDRDPALGTSYNEDVPVFELPRAPLLSLGSLQHLMIVNERPFSTGNSWGGATLNSVFDQCFLSGLTPDTDWRNVAQALPSPLLHVVGRKSDGTAVVADDLNGPERQIDGFSAKYLLQRGAFNLNSTSKHSWTAALRSVRFTVNEPFTALDADPTSGTAADVVAPPPGNFVTEGRVAAFARFAQSAHETFKSEASYRQSVFGGNGPIAETSQFRRGVRTLTEADVALLAEKIVGLVTQKQQDSGPFRSMVEFLSSSPLFLNAAGDQVSLLEKAIEQAALNNDAHSETGRMVFGAQFLTQADIMTSLAPVLFPRSDTFVVRTYGESVNPATSATEGRAWCEAVVQRVPEYFDPSVATGDAAEVAPSALVNTINQTYGRRFKIISFRWLTRSDI